MRKKNNFFFKYKFFVSLGTNLISNPVFINFLLKRREKFNLTQNNRFNVFFNSRGLGSRRATFENISKVFYLQNKNWQQFRCLVKIKNRRFWDRLGASSHAVDSYSEYFNRLDFLLYKIRFCKSVGQSRFFIRYKCFAVNNKPVSRCGFLLKEGDLVAIKQSNVVYFSFFLIRWQSSFFFTYHNYYSFVSLPVYSVEISFSSFAFIYYCRILGK